MAAIARRFRNLITQESGQALVITAVAMVAILAFAGLGIDIGELRAANRQLQAAADAAAIAGAIEVDRCDGTANCQEIQTSAQQSMSENGLTGSTLVTQCGTAPTGSSANLILELNNGPCALGSSAADPHYGNVNFVEAVVTKNVPTFFSRVLGINSMPISARAEAAMGNSPFCVYVGEGVGTGTGLTMVNGGQFTANCGVQDNSTLTLKNGVHIADTIFNVAGNVSGNSNQVLPLPNQNAPMLPDPLSWVPTPAIPSGLCQTITVSSNTSLDPGYYCSITVTGGTLTLNGCSTNCATAGSNVYYMTGNITTQNGAGLTGSNVTVYFSSGTFALDSGSTVTLSAPTNCNTASYAGILMYQASSDTTMLNLDSGSKSSWNGAFYLPGAEININSGGNLAAYTIFDALSLNVDSGAKFNMGNDYSTLTCGSPAKGINAVLTE